MTRRWSAVLLAELVVGAVGLVVIVVAGSILIFGHHKAADPYAPNGPGQNAGGAAIQQQQPSGPSQATINTRCRNARNWVNTYANNPNAAYFSNPYKNDPIVLQYCGWLVE